MRVDRELRFSPLLERGGCTKFRVFQVVVRKFWPVIMPQTTTVPILFVTSPETRNDLSLRFFVLILVVCCSAVVCCLLDTVQYWRILLLKMNVIGAAGGKSLLQYVCLSVQQSSDKNAMLACVSDVLSQECGILIPHL